MLIFNYNKSELVLHANKYQSHIWSKILKLEKRNIFYNQIITDGFSCSLLFILKKYKEVIEFPKLEELSKEKCDEYLTDKYKIIRCDMGVIGPITLIDKNNNFYKYSACRNIY